MEMKKKKKKKKEKKKKKKKKKKEKKMPICMQKGGEQIWGLFTCMLV